MDIYANMQIYLTVYENTNEKLIPSLILTKPTIIQDP